MCGRQYIVSGHSSRQRPERSDKVIFELLWGERINNTEIVRRFIHYFFHEEKEEVEPINEKVYLQNLVE